MRLHPLSWPHDVLAPDSNLGRTARPLRSRVTAKAGAPGVLLGAYAIAPASRRQSRHSPTSLQAKTILTDAEQSGSLLRFLSPSADWLTRRASRL